MFYIQLERNMTRFKYFIEENQIYKSNIIYKVLTWDQLSEKINRNWNDLANRIKYSNNDNSYYGSEYKKFLVYIAAIYHDKIVGLVKLGVTSGIKEDNMKGIYYVCVDPEFKQLGIGKALIQKMFELAQIRNYELYMSSYTKDGRSYLGPTVESMKKKYPDVKVVDSILSDYED